MIESYRMTARFITEYPTIFSEFRNLASNASTMKACVAKPFQRRCAVAIPSKGSDVLSTHVAHRGAYGCRRASRDIGDAVRIRPGLYLTAYTNSTDRMSDTRPKESNPLNGFPKDCLIKAHIIAPVPTEPNQTAAPCSTDLVSPLTIVVRSTMNITLSAGSTRAFLFNSESDVQFV